VTDEANGGRPADASVENDAGWWSIEGETTGERVRDGLPQLVIILVGVWLGTTVAYNVLSAAFDPISATASIAIGSLYVGLRLRRWLTVDDGADDRGDEQDSDAADERANERDADAESTQ